jgi:hypothetical protein
MSTMSEDEKQRMFKKLNEIQEEQHRTNQALFGDEQLGLKGVVSELAELKEWKSKIELKTAAISGGVAVLLFFGKYLFTVFLKP